MARLKCEHFFSLYSLRGREGVNVGEFRPGDGDHFRGGVELHRAGSEADHRRVQGEVFVLEALQVPQHLGLFLLLLLLLLLWVRLQEASVRPSTRPSVHRSVRPSVGASVGPSVGPSAYVRVVEEKESERKKKKTI